MRTIKFRGKNSNGEWKYGSLIAGINDNGTEVAFIAPRLPIVAEAYDFWGATMYRVDPATVGQFTGLTDADGKDIYEGDLLLSDENAEVFEVVYDAPRFCFKDNDFGFRFLNHPEFFHVLGNVFENPDLIEKGGEG